VEVEIRLDLFIVWMRETGQWTIQYAYKAVVNLPH
jgi:hypothetical protein